MCVPAGLAEAIGGSPKKFIISPAEDASILAKSQITLPLLQVRSRPMRNLPCPAREKPVVRFEDLRVGHVLQADWDPRLFRILAFDRIEVLYDCWSHVGTWSLQNLRGRAYYYRVPTELILSGTKALRVDPLSEPEWSVHRPDLPLRLLRFKEFDWHGAVTSSISAFSAWFSTVAPGLALPSSDVALDIPTVALAPYGPKGGIKRPVVITAENGRHFSSLESLRQAAGIQASISNELRHGVGIYRLGFASERPLFYLWGSLDRAGFLAH